MFDNLKLSDLDFNPNTDFLGKGSFGHVYKVKYNSQIYALKIIEENNEDNRQFKNVYREYNIMKNLNHPNIEKIYAVFKEFYPAKGKNCYFFLFELIEGQNLEDFLKSYMNFKQNIDELSIIKILNGIVNGLEYLHQQGIMHRDISLSNIMLTQEDEIKITDFGISAYIHSQNNYIESKLVSNQSIVGREDVIAPEIYQAYIIFINTGQKNNNCYDSKCDIYSLGIVMFKLMTFCYPSCLKIRNIQNLTYADQINPEKYDQGLINIVMSMLQDDPRKRPSCEQIHYSLAFMKERIEMKMSGNLSPKYSAFSSVMKCFSNTEEIYKYLIGNTRNKNSKKRNNEIYSVINSFMNELEYSKSNERLNDEYITKFVQEISKKILIFEEEEYILPKVIIQIFFDYFLSNLQNMFIYNNIKGNIIYEAIKDKEEFSIINKLGVFKELYKNIFVNTFYFLVLKKYICPKCNSIIKQDLEIKYEIEFFDKGNTSELLNYYLQNNNYSNIGLNSMPCNKCGLLCRNIIENKSIYLEPDVFIFHFNYFVILDEVLSLIQVYEIKQFIYSLKSVILSYKDKNDEEKFATAIKNNDKWVYYTDNDKNFLSLSEIHKKGTIRTVFYEKINS